MNARGRFGVAVLVFGAATSCQRAPATDFARLMEARQVAADLLVQLTKSADAGNRAVMADTDDASAAFAHEAELASDGVSRDRDRLVPLLRDLGYADESRLLDDFSARFEEYRALEKSILELAVENSNLKAQRLSFGPAQDAADRFRDALDVLVARTPTKDAARAQALAAAAIAAVREVQVLQAPHIAESDDAAMTRLEKRASDAEAVAKRSLDALAPLVPAAARSELADARDVLDHFIDLNAQLVALSRRNSNVRSLAMSLGQKRTITATCEERLHALQDALAKRGFTGTK